MLQITVNSLKDAQTEHEIIITGITSDGDKKEELITSDEIEGGSSDTINFNPADIQEVIIFPSNIIANTIQIQ